CPACVPLALLAGRAWMEGRTGRLPILAWATLAALALLVAIAPEGLYGPLVGRFVYARWWSQAAALRPVLALAAAVVLLGAVGASRARAAGVRLGAVAATLAVGLAVVEVARETFPSAAMIGRAARARAAEADRLVSYGHFQRGLPFYARRRAAFAAWHSMEEFGSQPWRAIVW